MFSFFKSQSKLIDLSFLSVDMHSHLLPALDDGASSLSDSIFLINELHALGYKKLICTPHVLSGIYDNTTDKIKTALALLNNELQNQNIPVEIAAAAEYMVDFDFELMVDKKLPLLTFGKNYVLIEMSYVGASPNIEKVIFNLRVAGYVPVIAHPERYNYYHKQFKYYYELKERGCLLQLNLLSLMGYYGGYVKKIAEQLLHNQMIDFIGTDLHHQQHLMAIKKFVATTHFAALMSNTSFLNNTL